MSQPFLYVYPFQKSLKFLTCSLLQFLIEARRWQCLGKHSQVTDALSLTAEPSHVAKKWRAVHFPLVQGP